MNAVPMTTIGDDQLQALPLDKLHPHPQNPRKIEKREAIASIAAQLRTEGFHQSHAIIVRPNATGFEIISGHTRVAAARLAKLTHVPAWVRELDDAEAYMQLILCNAQSELDPLERGDHARLAVEQGMTLRAYAERIGVNEDTVKQWKYAADVAVLSGQHFADLTNHMRHLAVIHAAPKETWKTWVERTLDNGWSVDELRDELKLAKSTKVTPSQKAFYRIEEWENLSADARKRVLSTAALTHFNEQENNSIEWARWSWNPITGCLHNCPYCYARDIANRFYPQKFEPSLIPGTLKAPRATPTPTNDGVGYHNVFVCSMADLFGKWVPAEWIDAVLDEVRANPQWNFLFLTKFPQRMAEFDYPDNAWLGTTVDLQARVKNAERAMDKVKAKVRWLSIEPLLERIRIDWSLFDWIVIGGSSASTETPAWQPPREWVWSITTEAQKAGCAVYHKDNLAPRLRDYPGAIEQERDKIPEQFQYLKVIA